jgi:hypothetical protein
MDIRNIVYEIRDLAYGWVHDCVYENVLHHTRDSVRDSICVSIRDVVFDSLAFRERIQEKVIQRIKNGIE